MSKLTVPEKFREIIKEILEDISSLISDANDAKLTKMLSNSVDSAIGLLALKNPEDMIKMFIKNNKLWANIDKRNLDFFINDLPTIFSDAPFDTNVLIEPIKVYKGLIANGYKGSMSQEKFPINDEDINGLWGRFDLLIHASVIHNKNINYKYQIIGKYYTKYNIQPPNK